MGMWPRAVMCAWWLAACSASEPATHHKSHIAENLILWATFLLQTAGGLTLTTVT